MMRHLPWRGVFKNTLLARIASVLVLNLVLIQIVAVVTFRLETSGMPPVDADLPERILEAVRLLAALPDDARPPAAHMLSSRGFRVEVMARLAPLPQVVGPPQDPLMDQLRDGLPGVLPADVAPTIATLGDSSEARGAPRTETAARRFAIGLDADSWAVFRIRQTAPPLRWQFLITLIGSVCVVTSVVSIVFARFLSRQLSTFVASVEAVGRVGEAPLLVERGPLEIRMAARAFNRMQERLRRFIHDRTQMLAAISHDLRTPLTRLRLRAEFVEDEEQRERMLHDIGEMEAMITATLAFARDDATRDQRRDEDLDQLIDELAETMREAGHDVAYAPVGPVMLHCSPTAIRRALGNLIDNGIKYGCRTRIRLSRTDAQLRIEIDDDGPGIPAEMQEQVFQPFFRLEASRNRDTGGVGLGLAVARTIIRGHGGDIALANRPEGGLRVTVTLPT
jgi:signal transduction histidine kinase